MVDLVEGIIGNIKSGRRLFYFKLWWPFCMVDFYKEHYREHFVREMIILFLALVVFF